METVTLENFLASFPDRIAVDTAKIKILLRDVLEKEEQEIYKKITKHYRKVIDEIVEDCIAKSINEYLDNNPKIEEAIQNVISAEIDGKVHSYLEDELIKDSSIKKQIKNRAYDYLEGNKIGAEIEDEIKQFVKQRITEEAFVKAIYRVYEGKGD